MGSSLSTQAGTTRLLTCRKSLQGLRELIWGCQVLVAQGISSHRAGPVVGRTTEICGLHPEGHWKVLVMVMEIFDVGLGELLSKSLGVSLFRLQNAQVRKWEL